MITMCMSPRIVRNSSNGSLYEVDCGRCEECRFRYSSRLFNMLMQYKKNMFKMLFVTLTYNNTYCPYILKSELFDMLDYGITPSIHQDKDKRNFMSHGKWKECLKFNLVKPFERAYKFDCESLINQLPLLVRSHRKHEKPKFYKDRVGILDYSHIQKLIKSLRKSFKFDFYCVGEYGSEKELYRPHWHLLFYMPTNQSSYLLRKEIERLWFRCSPRNKVFIEPVKMEKYISLYVTKSSKYNQALWYLSTRLVFTSYNISRFCDFKLSDLDNNLQVHRMMNNNGTLQQKIYFPMSRDLRNIMPYVKQPNVHNDWFTNFLSMFRYGKYKFPNWQLDRLFHWSYVSVVVPVSHKSSFYKKGNKYVVWENFEDSPFYINYRVSPSLDYSVTADMIDYSIDAFAFYRKFNSIKLRLALTEAPTIYTHHKKILFDNGSFPDFYGALDEVVKLYLTTFISPKFNTQKVYDFIQKCFLNQLSYELKQ